MTSRRALRRLLLACVREHDWGTPPDGALDLLRVVDGRELVDAARHHGVAGCVHRSLSSLTGPPAALEELGRLRAAALRSHASALADLRLVAPALDALGVPWLVFKGPVLAGRAYAHPDLRSSADVDLLVSGLALEQVLGALEATGARVLDRNWRLLRESLTAEVHVLLRLGSVADVHWHVMANQADRKAFPVDAGELLERRRPVEVNGLVVPTLDPEDTLLHLALHAARAGGNRLIWLKDLERAAAHDRPDWDELLRRAHAWRLGFVGATLLRRAETALGMELPDGLLEALAPSVPWRALSSTTDALAPVAAARGRRSASRLVARAAAPSARESFATLARNTLDAARSASLDPPDVNPDPTTAESVLFADGGASGRQRYVDAVRVATRLSG